MRISYDPAKRDRVLAERQLDFADAAKVFEGFHLTRRDERHSEVEDRFISIGVLGDDVIIIVWTERDEDRRIVTMWKANERERTAYWRERARSG
jgi:uncharacterized protein